MNRVACLSLAFGCALGVSTLSGCGNKPGSEPSASDVSIPTPKVDRKVVENKKSSKENLSLIAKALIDSRSGPFQQEMIPAGIYATDGKKVGLSWRVAILPALNHAELYKQFKLDEPWDGPNNKNLIAKMPAVYAAPGKNSGDGMTYYRSFTGKETVMPPPIPGEGGKIVGGVAWPFGIPDGCANTAMLAEAAESVIWTKPDELEFDRQKPLPKLGGVFSDGYHIAFADTDVHFFKAGSLSDETLKAIITPAGGEPFTLPEEPGAPQRKTRVSSR